MKQTELKSVTVSCRAPDATAVFVAGSFNAWQPNATPLHLENGQWTGTLQLSRGHYEYKFVVDGQWCCEAGCEHEYAGCPQCVPNAFGTMNRCLDVA